MHSEVRKGRGIQKYEKGGDATRSWLSLTLVDPWPRFLWFCVCGSNEGDSLFLVCSESFRAGPVKVGTFSFYCGSQDDFGQRKTSVLQEQNTSAHTSYPAGGNCECPRRCLCILLGRIMCILVFQTGLLHQSLVKILFSCFYNYKPCFCVVCCMNLKGISSAWYILQWEK